MRIGTGYDAHRLVAGRALIIGGVRIPFDKGLLGHSDADVLLHAVCDAILGAAGLGDIGRHFPDSDNAFKDIASTVLLERVGDMALQRGFVCGNVDAVVICQTPRLAPYLESMQKNIATCLRISPAVVNIKATTTEGMGFEGRGEGIAAQAVVLLRKRRVKRKP
ncbi:MAG: 2-C-methyl-D-erythritol 2,4-cyclodiphosphate synthase [Desulfobacterota bacterium]|nr:2-C-methyl-D-erythritol 2,4-cyclodiphosphate synthase [Thermodesulfobacteriota bacterium]